MEPSLRPLLYPTFSGDIEVMDVFPKPARVIDLQALRDYHDAHLFCEMCGKPASKTPHHLRTRGAGGPDTPDNLMSLCPICHTRIHQEAKFKERALKVKHGRDHRV